ncbi:phosphoribosyl-ATP diphosphatase [Kaistia dalseonensis]|uniref:Phosphoribosyl-ATP pyrophosphatase n=1 Tax=Kaistia dalseonensis TaxID=410840 RepID=A0ABU0H6P2_9HYPH|nr:phosphoribosyl-ATP diphosphatase [Kaistia dalseonensis]MCX5494859.1 phosphoribosyl-ATP diphosphatase [Kaistia dalseonensis]MDQ0437440.1 phosphoribosyl-ATP pyrophosphohydrolase [Kaistia dalseonensis]
MSSFTLADLAAIIKTRAHSGDPGSYTAKLVARGASRAAKKFGEEAVELAIAAAEKDRAALTSEAADVLYHLLVVLEASDVPLDAVMNELAGRTGRTGLEEKASRPPE